MHTRWGLLTALNMHVVDEARSARLRSADRASYQTQVDSSLCVNVQSSHRACSDARGQPWGLTLQHILIDEDTVDSAMTLTARWCRVASPQPVIPLRAMSTSDVSSRGAHFARGAVSLQDAWSGFSGQSLWTAARRHKAHVVAAAPSPAAAALHTPAAAFPPRCGAAVREALRWRSGCAAMDHAARFGMMRTGTTIRRLNTATPPRAAAQDVYDAGQIQVGQNKPYLILRPHKPPYLGLMGGVTWCVCANCVGARGARTCPQATGHVHREHGRMPTPVTCGRKAAGLETGGSGCRRLWMLV